MNIKYNTNNNTLYIIYIGLYTVYLLNDDGTLHYSREVKTDEEKRIF